jgi:hypothetical protein
MNGFSLVELMLSLSLGLGLSGVMLQGLMAEGQNGARFSRLVRERAVQRRTLQMVKGDLAQATAVSSTPALEKHACSLAGRTPVLHLSTEAGPITYSVGAAPSAIWRGRVLMRCGPAYGVDGIMSGGSQSLNRVVIDGLVVESQTWRGCETLLRSDQHEVTELSVKIDLGFVACVQASTGLLGLHLEQSFAEEAGQSTQRITQSTVVQAMVLNSSGVD